MGYTLQISRSSPIQNPLSWWISDPVQSESAWTGLDYESSGLIQSIPYSARKTNQGTAGRIMACGTNQGPERRISAPRDRTGPRETNKGPKEESGLLKTNQVLRPVRPTRTPHGELGHRGMHQDPAGWVRTLRDESGLRRKNRVLHDESRPLGTDQGAEGWIRPLGTDQGSAGRIMAPRDGSGTIGIDWGPTGLSRAPE